MENLHYAAAALRHLRRRDVTLRPVLSKVGPFALELEESPFGTLVSAIISQQVSTSAAAAIERRLVQRVAPRRVTPKNLLALSLGELRTVGLSRAKATYMHDLAAKVHSGVVPLRRLHAEDDETVIEQLTQVKGIGRWTAEMFLIFSLGRPDVLPVDDFGLRAAIKLLDGMPELPTRAEVRARATIWQPYRTVGTWYLWQNLKLQRKSVEA